VASADSLSPALELPLDAQRTATSQLSLATVPIAAAAPDDATLVAAFAAQLARYNGQADIPITASRLGAGGEVAWTAPLIVGVADRSFGELRGDAAVQLAKPAAIAPRGGGDHAAVSFVAAGARDVAAVIEASACLGRDADLHLVSRGGRLMFVYNAAALERASVARMAGHLAVMLGGLSDAAHVGELPLLAPDERAWLDAIAHGTPRVRPFEAAHRIVESFARATPHATAVRHRSDALTYADFDRRANRLAHALVARGVTGQRVVVCLEPSLESAIAPLAIWKAGAIYVPLDPSYPAARVAVILDDTQPAVVLTRGALIARHGFVGHAVVDIDEPVIGPDDVPPAIDVSPSDPAYVFYTSGTTGKPKGVVASHANLAHYLAAARDRYALCARDVMPALARTSFSISIFELMSPLTCGGTLVVLDRDVVLDPARLADTLASGVTVFHAGPSLLKALFAHVARSGFDVARFDGVRHASSGGDLVPVEVLRALVATFRAAEVFVIYGCSEIACMGLTYPVPRDRALAKTYVGQPFDNVAARVLDRAGNPVPVGVVGEVHFAGDGVALGYLARPELTADKFRERAGLRWYNTGDLGRVAVDGNVELLGRGDFQIKVRGMRIELAEVEYHLRKAPGVKDGVVVAREVASGERALIAYVVLDGGRGPDARAAIRRHLVDQLPDYMVPALYVDLPALPLNHNGKVDRNALPALAELMVRDDRVAPREPETPSELAIAGAFRALLHVDRVAIDDNFFELGGDSLTALELLASIERDLGVRLDGLDVLRDTLAGLAVSCDRRAGRSELEVAGRAEPATADAWDSFYFGDADALYGVLRGPQRADTAVLIVAPPDQDRARGSFVLAQLARKCAARGIPALAFDLYGCWDSLGDAREATLARWLRDIRDAAAELTRRTGATKIIGVGARLAAPLLCLAGVPLARLVLWDPVRDGASWYEQAAAEHRVYVRALQSLRVGRPPRRTTHGEELCGTVYARDTLRELAQLRLAPPRDVPCATHATSIAWFDPVRIDELLPDPGISRALLELVSP
jgi:amino acid adenylation domain-containing protein